MAGGAYLEDSKNGELEFLKLEIGNIWKKNCVGERAALFKPSRAVSLKLFLTNKLVCLSMCRAFKPGLMFVGVGNSLS